MSSLEPEGSARAAGAPEVNSPRPRRTQFLQRVGRHPSAVGGTGRKDPPGMAGRLQRVLTSDAEGSSAGPGAPVAISDEEQIFGLLRPGPGRGLSGHLV